MKKRVQSIIGPFDKNTIESFLAVFNRIKNGAVVVEVGTHEMDHAQETISGEYTCLRIVDELCGFKLIESPHLDITSRVQFRFPRSKKKRIRKKFSKDPKNFRDVKRHEVFMIGNTCACSPSVAKTITDALNKRMDNMVFCAMANVTP
jgi:hypothetical protein